MSKEVKAALITGICTIIAAIIGEKILITVTNPPEPSPGPTIVMATVTPDNIAEPTVEPTIEPTVEPEESKEIDIRELTPLIGNDEDFWEEAIDEQDNLGNENYSYSIFCGGDSFSNEITYPLDKKYKSLKGTIALSQKDNDIGDGAWLEFYDGKKCIGHTKHLKAGVRPFEFSINVEGVEDLKIVSTASTMHLWANILTNGFFLE